MNLFLNFGFAWISVILTVVLSIIYILRKLISKSKNKKSYLSPINRNLRKHHKLLGILLVITGLIHGLFSSESILSLNLGTLAWVVSILLGLNWMVRKKLLKYKGWIYYHRILTVLFILTIFLHVVQVGGIQAYKLLLGSGTSAGKKVVAAETAKAIEGATFKDGTYIGEAEGFRPGIKVSVEIKNNSIISIEVLEHNEVNSRFYQRAFDTIPQAILDSQTTDVDTTSGATFTSTGIINAVNNALKQALISGTLPDNLQLPQNRGHGRDFGERGRN